MIINPEYSQILVEDSTVQTIINKLILSSVFYKIEIFFVLGCRLGFFFYLISLFIVFLTSCTDYLYFHNQNTYITRFPTKPDNQTVSQIGIPFCSVLYKPGKQYKVLTLPGEFNYWLCWFYFGFEIAVFLVNKTSRSIRQFKVQKNGEIALELLKILIPTGILVALYFLGSYIFQVYVYLITNTNQTKLDFYTNLKRANRYYGDTLVIQVKKYIYSFN